MNAKDETEQSAYLIATSEVGPDPELLELTLAQRRRRRRQGLLRRHRPDPRRRARLPAIVRRLLATPIELDHVNRLGWTALLEAIVLGEEARHVETVRLLVAAGADVELADGDGVPARHAERRGLPRSRILGAPVTGVNRTAPCSLGA